jgi:hypothetical protein
MRTFVIMVAYLADDALGCDRKQQYVRAATHIWAELKSGMSIQILFTSYLKEC